MSEDNLNVENTEVVDQLPEDAPVADANAERIAALEGEITELRHRLEAGRN